MWVSAFDMATYQPTYMSKMRCNTPTLSWQSPLSSTPLLSEFLYHAQSIVHVNLASFPGCFPPPQLIFDMTLTPTWKGVDNFGM